jgi:hypothetical protein
MRRATALALLTACASASLQTYTLRNPTSSHAYADELVRLPLSLRGAAAASLCLTRDGQPAAFQVELLAGTLADIGAANLWVAATLAPGQAAAYALEAGGAACPAPPPPQQPAAAALAGGQYLLSNGLATVALPGVATAAFPPPPPFAGFSTGGRGAPAAALVGSSAFNFTPALAAAFSGFTPTLLASGPLFVEVALNYSFGSGAFASWTVRLALAQLGPQVTERHVRLDVDAAVDVALHTGWAPSVGLGAGFAYCDPSTPSNPAGMNASAALQVLPLAPIPRLPSGGLGYMMPRWSQACDSRFYWGVGTGGGNGSAALGVLALRGGDWLWPQYRSLAYETMRWHLMGPWSAGAGTGFLHLPLYGNRVWYVLGGALEATALRAGDLQQAYAGQALERLTNVYDLAWPGTAANTTYDAQGLYFFYNGDTTNPTHSVRQRGNALLASLAGGAASAPPAGLATLAAANSFCDPDWWGSYVGYSSPENPNFFTDWSKLCLGWSLAVALRGHPRAPFFCALARGVWEADLRHAVALPSGAGQESPGYTAHALGSWVAEAPLLDRLCPNASAPAVAHPRLRAAAGFLLRTSQPWAYHFLGPAAARNDDVARGRFVLPMGDTHPTSANFTQILASLAAAGIAPPELPPLAQWGSAELPGYGALLQRGAGTPSETFLALKASPSRCHNHGEQLGIHYAAYGARTAIDIMAGYNPRPYQEFWHNRLCFGELQNLDGYERLLGFAASASGSGAAVAVGQVASARLLSQPAVPPQNYLQVFPTQALAAPLVYRRAALLVPSDAAAGDPHARDYIVLCDAHTGGVLGVGAYGALTFFQQDGTTAVPRSAGVGGGGLGLDVGNATLYAFAASGGQAVRLAAAVDRWDWPSEGNENATRVLLRPAAPASVFVTVLYPDGSAMAAAPGLGGGGGASCPVAVAFNASSGALTLAFASGHTDVLTLRGALLDASVEAGSGEAGAPLATLARGGGAPEVLLRAGDLSARRPQGDIGLVLLDAGYTFGEVPAQVVAERSGGADEFAPPASYPWPPSQYTPY